MKNEIHIKHLNFGSFIKFNSLISLSIGIVFGVIMFIVSLLGGDVNAELNGEVYTGITAGIMGIFLSPFIMLFIGLILSLILFLPLWAALKISKGIKIKGDFIMIDFAPTVPPNVNSNNEDKEVEVHIPWAKK